MHAHSTGGRTVTRTIPFTPLEAGVFHLERAMAPWNIQFELASHDPLSPARLAAAVERAARHHRMAGVRCAPGDDPTAHWVVDDRPAVEVTRVGDDPLDEFRTRFYGERIDLSTTPPFRVALARGAAPGAGDRVLFCTSHVPMDGVGTLRLVRSVCRAYRGDPLADPVGVSTARRRYVAYGDSTRGTLRRAGETLSRLVTALRDPPARLAREGGTDDPRWGFHHQHLDPALVTRLIDGRPPNASVNDALLAALHRAVASWNAVHDRPTDRVSLMVPVNARPESSFYEGVGMFAPFVSVAMDRADRRDWSRTLATVRRQTRRVTSHDSAAWVTDVLDTLGSALPAVVGRGVPWLLDRTDYRLVDTAVLSNLGRVPSLPGFTADSPAGVWFSPPTVMPMGVGIGVVTHGGAMRLAVRYAFEQFDAAAADRFTDHYLKRLRDVV